MPSPACFPEAPVTEPRLAALGRAVPERRYTQRDLWELRPFDGAHALFDRLFLDSDIQGRGLFVPPTFFSQERTLTECNAAWREGALALGGAALSEGLSRAHADPADLALLAVTTVTGYTTPGLDLLLARAGGLRNDVARAHFNCIGCHAALPLLKVATDHVRAAPERPAAALAVEICSACLRLDGDPQNLVALSLFGDGAAAAIVSADGPGPRIVDFGSAYDFEHLDALGFDLTTTGFRIVLDPAIPRVIAANIQAAIDDLLARNGVSREQVSTWCFHPGGSRILDACAERLQLDEGQMAASRRVLAEHGNMSSPSILFVLAEALAAGGGVPGSFGVLAAFGPGLGIELCLLRFEDDGAVPLYGVPPSR